MKSWRSHGRPADLGDLPPEALQPLLHAVADWAMNYRAEIEWLHVDAAYGGALGLLPERRWVLDGLDRADSLVVNPHKWLFVPLDFSVLYMRNPALLKEVFALTPEYLRGEAPEHAVNYMDYGIQLGRRFRALKAWMVIRAFGTEGLAARIREHCRLARLLTAWVSDDPRFRLMAPVHMGVVCLRAEPQPLARRHARSLDRLNERVVEEVNASGRAYLIHTRLRGQIAIRVGIGNLLTTEDHIRLAWRLIREHVEKQTHTTHQSPGGPNEEHFAHRQY